MGKKGTREMSNNYRDGGKGDMPRPILNQEQFDKSWDEIFGKKSKKDDSNLNVTIEADNDEQSVTITKTWEI